MQRSKVLRICLPVICLALLASTVDAGYVLKHKFDIVTPSGIFNPVSASVGLPALNDNNQLAVNWRTSVTSGLSTSVTERISVFNGSSISVIFSDSDTGTFPNSSPTVSVGNPSINNHGAVSFYWSKHGNSANYVWDNGTLTPVLSGASSSWQSFQQALNDAGQLVYKSEGSLKTIQAGSITTIGPDFPGMSVLGINNNGDVAIAEFSGSSSISIIPSGGPPTLISGPLGTGNGPFSFNDAGQVMFSDSQGDLYLLSASASPLLLVDVPDGWTISGMSLNDMGGFAYMATDPSNITHLYATDPNGGAPMEMIRTGELFGGFSLRSIGLGGAGLDNYGNVAIRYILDKPGADTYGVAILSVPESSAFTLCAIGGFIGAFSARRCARWVAQ